MIKLLEKLEIKGKLLNPIRRIYKKIKHRIHHISRERLKDFSPIPGTRQVHSQHYSLMENWNLVKTKYIEEKKKKYIEERKILEGRNFKISLFENGMIT